ncbi:type I-E CRISPR-associated endonuclease Cas1e [Nocardioides houyundeii]|uniref:type I-E CRISPR-associated endonuclease Cas1e n=1 Tax=Nocardioides houyundeii TaxID=2045452 RepID=UPI000C783955|nr:type I-E CRISPR-associated endonuclease Cas1e [Nocardioides houyundeii]
MTTHPALARPNAMILTRISDRLSYLYLDRCRIERDDNGVHAKIEAANPEDMPAGVTSKTTYIPISSLTSIMLGPGTSITQPAAAACAAAGTGVCFVGSGVVRSYGAFLSPYSPTRLLEAQARIFADDDKRTEIAREALLMRFPETGRNMIATASIEQLRGLEGARMKAIYKSLASKHRLAGWRRNTGALGPLDPVNEALNYANTALYGLVNAVVQSLGLSPGLGFVHAGNRQAFVLDIADLYKGRHTIPLCFSLHSSKDPGAEVMAALRKEFRLLRLLPQVVDDIHALLGVETEEDDWSVDALSLWAADGKLVRANTNYGRGLDASDLMP